MGKISIKKAVAIYGMAKYSSIIIQLFISALLSRLLTPKDYGVVAIVSIFTILFNTLGNLGLGTAVTQYRDLTKQDIQDIFTFSEYFSVVLMLVFAGMAYPISIFYENYVYIPIVLLLTISTLFNTLNMIPDAILRREQKFLMIGIRMIVSTAVSGIVAVVLAFMGAKYYALVIQSILNAVIQFIWNFNTTKLRICLKFRYAPVKRVQNYSVNQFIYNLCNYVSQNLDNLLTGKIMGNEILAFYNKGYTLMRYPVNNIAHAITPVLHPILSEHQNDKNYIYDEFIKIIKVMSLLGVFITVVCFWADKEIIICYFGNQWYDAVNPFKCLSICICVQLMNALFGSIYQSLGCTKQMFQSGLFHISVSLLAIIVGAFTKNITLLALLVSISMFIKFFIETIFLIKKSFGFSVLKFLSVFIPEISIFTIMFIIMLIIGDIPNVGLWMSLFIKTGISIIVYFIMLIITNQQKYLSIVVPNKIKKKFKR